MNKAKLISIRVLLLIACFFNCNAIFAYNFEVNGICYSYIQNTNNVAVAHKWTDIGTIDSKYYSGDIVVPETVYYEGNTYNVVSIDYKAFSTSKNLKSVSLPNSIRTIGSSAFEDCQALVSVKMPDNISSINQHAFKGCTSLESIDFLPKTLTSIEYGLFENCKGLLSVKIPDHVTEIGPHSFGGCINLETVYIPGSVKTIEYNAFYNCSKLSSLTISNGVEKIGSYSFFKTAIATLVIPESVTSIGTEAFYWAPLTLVKSEIQNPPRIDGRCFDGETLQVPKGTKELYEMTAYWKENFKEIIEFGESTTYTLSIKSSGNGYSSYKGTTIRDKTTSFTINKGSSVTISFTPDDGYQIKSVKVNGSIISLTNNQYTISSISGNTSVEVEFEAIPQTTCIVSIKASGNGSVSYNGETIRNETKNYTVNIGTSITVYFHADEGYRLKSLRVNNISISGNQYCTTTINRNTIIEVEYEAIPTTNYTLSITATGNGSVSYEGSTIRSRTSTFKVNEGANVTLSISPDNGNRLKSVKINDSDVTNNVSNNSYTISNISKDTSVEVEFAEELKSFMSDGISYSVSSYDDKTIIVVGGDFGRVLDVPATISYQDHNWKVIGIDNVALIGHPELAAIIWNPTAGFTLDVSNPNLLLYVTSANYAPSSITNVIVNNTAEKIILTDASSGNDFYCPKAFTANSINYTHNYVMTTGIGESRGWETIALPFDVQKIIHSGKGEITPFVNWKSDDSKKPFWLMTYGVDGWTEANSIKANTPYIISMPNHQNYKSDFRLSGSVTFSAENITVSKSDDYQTGSYNGNTFVPNFANIDNSGYYTLNVNNDYVTYSGGSAEGSRFVVNLRPVHPFEAYMTSTSSTRSIGIDEGMATGIMELISAISDDGVLKIYNLNGQLVKIEEGGCLDEVMKNLPAGVYIVNGKKMIIR